eukprot:357166-Chlamydomonas_euryale.AAC.8
MGSSRTSTVSPDPTGPISEPSDASDTLGTGRRGSGMAGRSVAARSVRSPSAAPTGLLEAGPGAGTSRMAAAGGSE